MTRTYILKRRAEQLAETRRRIVEAAVDLHSSIGPGLTTMTMIAERAGVQRHTLYAHFLRTSHRIVVLREREKVAEFSGEVDENTIIHAIAGSEA